MSFDSLIELQQTLKTLRENCQWTSIQTPQSIAHFTIEEAYELCDAIDGEDQVEVEKELADLLYHLVFYIELYPHLSLEQIAQRANQKLIDRHPEVFNPEYAEAIDNLADHWQRIKQQERQQYSLLDGIASSLPSLTRAQKIQERVRVVGFDWEKPQQVFAQLCGEVDEVKAALAVQSSADVLEEIGDVMFCCVNLIRHLGGDAETVMRQSNQKFQNRFQMMESFARLKNQSLESLSLQQLEELWKQAKNHLAKSY